MAKKQSAIIGGSWDSTILLCGCHEHDMVPMRLQAGPYSMHYVCAKSSPAELNEEEDVCRNRISIDDFEKALGHLNDEIVESDEQGIVANMTHHKWKTSKGITYEVLSHTADAVMIRVLNPTSLRK